MSNDDIERIVAEYARSYPPIISAEQALEIAGVARTTLYDWSSNDRLDRCKIKRRNRGGKLRFDRDGFVRFICGDVHEA
jgi:hypothetical protein